MTARTRAPLAAALLVSSALTFPLVAAAQDGDPAAQTSVAPASAADTSHASLEEQFRDPPQSARPRVWWHWMNGNITKDGIAKDIAWMKRAGIGGLQNFDANLQTPQIVDKRLVYMTPEWKDAFRFATREADRNGLELAIAASPGWSETGGPWVKPQDGLKKLVWSETSVAAGKRFAGKLAAPPSISGPYQTLEPAHSIEEMISGVMAPPPPRFYGEVGVFAVPEPIPATLPAFKATDGLGNALAAAALIDGDASTQVAIARKDGKAPEVRLDYARPVTIRSATIFVPGASLPFVGAIYAGLLEASSDGKTWTKVADVTLGSVPTTVAFAPVTAAHFRLAFQPVPPRAVLGSAMPGLVMGGDMMGGMAAKLAKMPFNVGAFRLDPNTAVDRFETKAGFVMSRDYYALAEPTDGAKGVDPGAVVDLTGKLSADGTLDWQAPALPVGQRWRVLRMGYSLLGTTNHPAPPEATGLEVDKYDGPAVRGYLEHYLGMYKDAAGADMVGKKGVRALLTDSIEVGEANWTPRMVEQFTKLRGYDPRPWLPAMAGVLVGSRADTDKFLYDYRRTLADLLASEHYGTVAKVAHENDLIVYGEALEDKRPMLGDDMTMRKHADIPMAAMWTFRDEGPRQTLIADMKGAASVAHIYGRKLVAAESMTASMAPWAFAPKDLKRFIDMEFVNGINRPVIHTSVHVPVDDKKPGLSLFIFGQYFNRMESWAEMARPWVDYMARSSLLLQQGRNVADLGYFYGEEAPLTGLYGDKPVADAPVRHAFDYVSFDALANELANDGAELVSKGGARYRALYLGGSSGRMTLAALQRLAALVEGGATVIGKAPVSDPGMSGATAEWSALVGKLWSGAAETRVGKGRVIASTDVEAALAAAGVAPDFRFEGGTPDARIPFVHRRDGKDEIYFLSNQQDAAQTITARFRVTGKAPRLWRAETGTSEAVPYRVENGETVVPLTLNAGDAVFVAFRDAAGKQPAPRARTTTPVLALDEGWSVRFQADRGAPASITLSKLESLTEQADPAVKYFSGIATYSRDFTLAKAPKKGEALWLDLGAVGDLADVTVNGVPVGAPWHAPYRVDIGKAAKKGVNTLQVRVANTWVNRLVGDAQPGAQSGSGPITWTALPTYRADAPLRPAGLIGPVSILSEK